MWIEWEKNKMLKATRNLFARFQNLNLLFLIHDLRRGLIARGNWLAQDRLCPVAHGMADGAAVEHLEYLNHARNFDVACAFAARELALASDDVSDFVRRWDETPAVGWLLDELEQIWVERLEDAEALQSVLRLDVVVEMGDADRRASSSPAPVLIC
jgi:hypothetical protein